MQRKLQDAKNVKSFAQAFSKACRFLGQRPKSLSAESEILLPNKKTEFFAHDITHLFERIADVVLMCPQFMVKAQTEKKLSESDFRRAFNILLLTQLLHHLALALLFFPDDDGDVDCEED